MELKDEIRTSRMTRFQIGTIAVCFILNMVDGFDTLILAFASPALAKSWHLDPVTLGYLLSASLIGIAIGAFVLAPMADRIGRRNVLLLSLVLVSLGSILAIFAQDPPQLFAFRVIVGLGLGGMLSNISVLVIEYSSDKRSGTMMGLVASGYPLGATIGGIVTAAVVAGSGFRGAFVFGACVSVAMLIFGFIALPESMDYLLVKRPNNSLARVNKILAKMHKTVLQALPPLVERDGNRASVFKEVFGRKMLATTLLLWLSFGLLQASFYFVTSWTPQALTVFSGDAALGQRIGILVIVGGIAGALVFAALAIKVPRLLLTILFMLAGAVLFVVFAASFSLIGLTFAIGIVLGLVSIASIAGIYTIGPLSYSASARASGMGWLIGIGQVASIIAPIVVGYLFAAEWSIQGVFALFSIPMAGAAACLIVIAAIRRRQGVASDNSSALTLDVVPNSIATS